jgi:hypothetical protein
MHHTCVQMWQRKKWDIQEHIGTETKTGNKWQQARNFNTQYTVELEILTCLPLISGPTHLPRITPTFSSSLIHYELIFHWHRSQTSRRQSWNTVWTIIRLTPNLKHPSMKESMCQIRTFCTFLCVSCTLYKSNFSMSFIQPVMPVRFYLKKLQLIPQCNWSKKGYCIKNES